jgi:hypothetical protein
VEVHRHRAELLARGAEIVAVGQGTGREAARFCRMLKVEATCLGDPAKASYRAFGLPRDGWWNVTAQPFLEDPALAWSRIRHASLRGSLMRHTDVLQLGGVALVDREGVCRYLHRSRRTDDFPPMQEVLAAVDALTPPTPGGSSATGASR